MAIHKIDDVKINGKNQAFGGLIFAVDYDVGILDKPTTVTVNFISESGEYFEPELSVSKPYRIQIGNIVNGNFYAIRWSKRRSSSGRELEVVFHDGSILLDRIWVGLNKRMGDSKTNVPGLIIVGREIHPCDVNEDGIYDQKDADLLAWEGSDPCELRCPNESKNTEPVIEQCAAREISEIFEVKYSFKELLDVLEGRPSSISSDSRQVSYPVEADLEASTTTVSLTLPPIEINRVNNKSNQIRIKSRPKSINEKYLAQYTGSLREVLRNWCADFGWSFFWEEDGLTFIDTKERPNIALKNFSNIESTVETKTLEGTVSRGFVSNYIHQGVKAQTSCSESRPLMLHCLTLRDLYGDTYKPAWNAIAVDQKDYSASKTDGTPLDPPIPDPTDSSPDNQREYRDDVFPNGVKIEDFEKSVVCSYYNDTLRHLYNLWDYYGIKSAEDAERMKNKWLDRLGQIKIVSVFSSTSQGDKLENFNRLLGQDFRDKDQKTLLSQEEIDNIKKYNGYIVVALKNRVGEKEDILDKQFRLEQNLADNFIGQHWYRAYTSPFYGETPQVFPNGQYFGALATNVTDLPFASFNHTYKSNVAKMVSSFSQRQRNDFRQYGTLKFASTYAKNISKKTVRSIIYFGRNTSQAWLPLKNTETQISDLIKELENYMFRVRALEDFGEDVIKRMITEGGKELVKKEFFGNLQLYVFYPVIKSGFKLADEITDNPNKEPLQHTESVEPYALATAGLLSNKCVKYTLNGTPIFTPAGASVLFQEQTEKFKWAQREPVLKDFSRPAYKVFVTNSRTNRGAVPKTETVFVLPADPSEVLKIEYQTKDVTKNSIQLLNSLTNECLIDPVKVKEIHEKLAKNLNYNVTKPFRSIQYTIMGVTLPNKLSIKDGLESLKVRVGENGVFTEIGIGDSLFTPPSPDFITRALEAGVNPKLANLQKNAL